MFNKSNDLKSESDRLCPPTELAGSGSSNQPQQQQQQPDRVKLLSSSSTRTTQQELAATTLHQHYLNYYSKKIPKEEIKSQHKACVASTSGQSQQLDSSHHQTTNHLEMQQSSSSPLADHQRGQQNGRYKTSNTYQQPPFQNQHHVNLINQTPRTSVPRDEAQTLSSPFSTTSRHNQMMPMNGSMKQRTFSASAIMAPNPHHTHAHAHNHHQHQNHSSNHRRQDELGSTNLYSNQTRHNSRQDGQQVSSQHQSDRGSEEVATIAIREELENDLDGFKEGELDTLSSLERTLPIELSFLIKQQAYCMARMNYLDRQIRELRESANQVDSHTAHVSSTSNNRMIPNHPQNHHNNHHHHHNNHHHHQQNPATIMTHTKNGNFILSDDSGGEYSRATISDDDELSSLLDQIVKTVKPERGAGANFAAGHGSIQQQQQLHHLQQPRSVATANYTAITSQPGQQYAFVNPSQIHHPHYQQAVPIFVMGSPVAVAHPASSISSNVLPGVHFQPEPRYNQYYEGFYCQNYGQPPSGSSLVQQRSATTGGGLRGPSNQHFDNSMSAIEQLVSQKEKRQIKSQLRSADNWLRMRASGHAPTDSSFNNGHSRNIINAASSSPSSSSSSATTTTTTPNGTTTTTTTTNHRESEISPDKSNGQSATSSTTTGRSNHNIPTSSSAATIATANKNHCEIDDNSDR